MSKVSIENYVERLISYAKTKLYLQKADENFVRNRLLHELNLDKPAEEKENGKFDLQKDILDSIVDYAVDKKIIKDEERILFETMIMGVVMPMPSTVNAMFDELCATEGVNAALKMLYDLEVDSNYIRMKDISKNICWDFTGDMGDVAVTINLSKPEKDPKMIAAQAKAKKTGYPTCMLCAENVGFYGTLTHPARQTLRTIPIFLAGESWFVQYSPYSYFNEHCIAFSEEHKPMHVDHKTYTRLLDFVELFPNYFLGSNAALPIVGGSILAHEHYQGGLKALPMFKRGDRQAYTNEKFKKVSVSIVDWYNSVIRVASTDRKQLEKCIDYISDCWESYSDESQEIVAKDTEQHNAITPIARKEGDVLVMDLILRNNRTDEKRPYGIFHVAEQYHNIKKEGIGLIEAMGKFILPGRLSTEAKGISDYLTGKTPLDFKALTDDENPLTKHRGMIAQLVNDYGTSLSEEKAGEVITAYVNDACVKILNNTAVFKNTDEGKVAFSKFLKSMGFCTTDGGDYELTKKVEEKAEMETVKKTTKKPATKNYVRKISKKTNN